MAAAVIRWASIGALYDPNLDRHRARAREYEHAVEEAKARTIEEGLQDNRPDAVLH